MGIKNQSGYVLVIALLVFLAIFTIGMSLTTRSSSLLNMQENAKKKIQSFYASDGRMTLLAQEIIDGHGEMYRSKNFLIYDDFGRLNKASLDSGWTEPGETASDKTELFAELALFTGTGLSMKPIIKKTFPDQLADTLIWQFDMNWGRSDVTQENYFSLFFQLGYNLINNTDSTTNVAVNLRWGDNKKTGFTSFANEVLGYLSSASSGKGLKVVNGAAHVKVIVDLTNKKYSIQIDGKEYAKNVAFYNSISKINTMRIFTNSVNTSNFYGRSIDNVSLLIKTANSGTSTDRSYGSFLVDWDVIQDEIGDFKIYTNSHLENAPSLNKYSTTLNQTISNQNITTVTFPNEKMAPVTFYDFHSDRTNPEFEQPFIYGLRKGMVQNKLVNGVPARSNNSTARMLNYYMAWWFQPSDTFSHVKIPMYTKTMSYKVPTAGDWLAPSDTSSTKIPTSITKNYLDSAFSNIVIHDSLKFVHIGGGMYQFVEAPDFFPLDHRGFGNEWNLPDSDHNYSYTMVLTHIFVKLPGQVFKFTGDDDVWAFVNDSLVMDLGGIHYAKSDSFAIDAMTSLKYNTVYTLKLFYCERHSEKSSINIITNMMEPIVTESKKRSWGRNYGNMN